MMRHARSQVVDFFSRERFWQRRLLAGGVCFGEEAACLCLAAWLPNIGAVNRSCLGILSSSVFGAA